MGKLIDEFGLAEMLGLSVLTLRRTRCCNPERHPPYKKLGVTVRYDVSEVERWINSKTVNGLDDQPTSTGNPKPSAKKDPRPHDRRPGRPSKAETVRAAKNEGK